MNLSFTAEDFPDFFRELWGENRDPFPWQKEFARRICAGVWPKYVAAPTGSGKTGCLDAAVFALALQTGLPVPERTAGRRIFFIVNRRVIVDEAYERAGKLCQALIDASPESVVGRVATGLRSLTGRSTSHPLIRVRLRGGIYRDRGWEGSLLQPMIICSTVDQAGSRILFRGYGVSEQARPIHAALLSQDSVLIVDEAHISRPFIETLEWVARFRSYQPMGIETIRLPFQFVQMTATLLAKTSETEQISLTVADYEHPALRPRLCKEKRAHLIIEHNAKGKNREEHLAKRLTKEARQILAEHNPRSLAVMVNRVATARLVHAELTKQYGARVILLIGRLRHLDREAVTKKIRQRLKTDSTAHDSDDGPDIVVSTQCLEVGADLDFDALVTEAASLDALRQRFGRLNRGGRDITARAVIVLPADQNLALDKLSEDTPCDRIYGNAIPRTWHWLQNIADDNFIDFGINSIAAELQVLREAKGDDALASMLSPTANAPVLLPAYLDCWVQTNPAPAPDPDIALFLHGPERDMAEVQVCWRADLPIEFREETWIETLSLCPPTSAECLPVPVQVFHTWISGQSGFEDLSGDVEECVQDPDRTESATILVAALIWHGPHMSRALRKVDDISPGDTIVLRAQRGGWQSLGVLPDAPPDPAITPAFSLQQPSIRLVDVAERGIDYTHRRAVLRVHRDLWPNAENGTAAAELMAMATNPEKDWPRSEIRELLKRLTTEEWPGWSFDELHARTITHLAKRKPSALIVDSYPDNAGFVVTTRVPLPANDAQDFESLDIDADAVLEAEEPLELSAHTRDVLEQLEHTLSLLPLDPWRKALRLSATFHDWGKADLRFQAMLRSSSVFAAMASGIMLAKSGFISSSAATRQEARERAGLPAGFRHEMLSMLMAENVVGESALPKDEKLRALTLHLIATHHGYGRPFAPVVQDDSPPDVSLLMREKKLLVRSAQRIAHPPHALDSGVTERFWQLTRHYGWWGLALLETVLRVADQQASVSSRFPSDNGR